MCTPSESCICCGAIVAPVEDTRQSQTLSSNSPVATASHDENAKDVVKIRIGLVSGKVLAEVALQPQDDVAVLETEARRALGGSPCDLVHGSRLLLSGQSVQSANLENMSQVIAVVNHKVVTSWNSEISYELLEFSDDERVVRRPKLVSANPAALVAADPEIPTTLCFRIMALPPTRTKLTAGVANDEFRKFFGKGFGKEENSWGIQWSLEKEAFEAANTRRHRPVVGDLICITCDLLKTCATVSLNGKIVDMFNIPSEGSYVLGATLSTDCKLSITSDDPLLPC